MRPERLDLYADRYVAFVHELDLEGYDLIADKSAFFAAQVRPIRDAGIVDAGPVPPMIDLPLVTDNSTGVRIMSVRTENGVPITTIRLFIDQLAMKGLPFGAERGEADTFAWDLQFAAINVVKGYLAWGKFIVEPRVTFT